MRTLAFLQSRLRISISKAAGYLKENSLFMSNWKLSVLVLVGPVGGEATSCILYI